MCLFQSSAHLSTHSSLKVNIEHHMMIFGSYFRITSAFAASQTAPASLTAPNMHWDILVHGAHFHLLINPAVSLGGRETTLGEPWVACIKMKLSTHPLSRARIGALLLDWCFRFQA